MGDPCRTTPRNLRFVPLPWRFMLDRTPLPSPLKAHPFHYEDDPLSFGRCTPAPPSAVVSLRPMYIPLTSLVHYTVSVVSSQRVTVSSVNVYTFPLSMSHVTPQPNLDRHNTLSTKSYVCIFTYIYTYISICEIRDRNGWLSGTLFVREFRYMYTVKVYTFRPFLGDGLSIFGLIGFQVLSSPYKLKIGRSHLSREICGTVRNFSVNFCV